MRRRVSRAGQLLILQLVIIVIVLTIVAAVSFAQAQASFGRWRDDGSSRSPRQRRSPSLGTLAVADYAAGGNIPLSGAPEGTGPKALPRYLLLYGGPDVLPWGLQ
jgi:hypothetical protein